MDWQAAGHAWGERAVDWAYLMEPYARRANITLLDKLGVVPGMRLLDIACGSGYAVAVAAERGAAVAGLDASEALIAIARARTPSADLRVGDMYALPFADDSFDVATSFNGIWKGNEPALDEARRVVRPGGLVGLTFWGSPKRMGLLPFFATVGALSPTSHSEALVEQGETGRPGVAEQMLAGAGLELQERGVALGITEFPDVDTGARALAAAGPSWPAVQAVGLDRVVSELRAAIEPMYQEGLGVRIVSELGWITARVAPG